MRIFSTSFNNKIFFLVFLIFFILFNNLKADIYVFGSEDCPNCQRLKSHLDSLEIAYKFFNLDIDSIFSAFTQLEDKLEKINYGDFPAVIIGDKIFYYKTTDNFFKKVDSLAKVNKGLKNIKTDSLLSLYNITPEQKSFIKKSSLDSVILVYFYKPGCSHCMRIEKLLDFYKRKNKNIKLIIKRYSILIDSNQILNKYLCQKYNVPFKKHLTAPIIFTSAGYLLEDATYNSLDSLIKISKYEKFYIISNKKKIKQEIILDFKKFSFLTIVIAGLIDGVNPCAFATIIFLIGYLIGLNKTRREILYAGISFTLGVFLTYFIIGIGFISIVSIIYKFEIVRVLLNLFVIGILIYFATLNLYDFIMIKKKRFDKVKLELSFESSKKIHENISKLKNAKIIYLNSFLIGIIISLLELACTGQVYLPTIIFTKEVYPVRSYFYLFIYNIMFIIPLVLVFSLTYWGSSLKTFQKFLLNNSHRIKLTLAIVLYIIGFILIYSVFQSIF